MVKEIVYKWCPNCEEWALDVKIDKNGEEMCVECRDTRKRWRKAQSVGSQSYGWVLR